MQTTDDATGIQDLVELLRCPECAAGLTRETDTWKCQGCERRYPIVRGVPRLLPVKMAEGTRRTGESFGWEWTKGWNKSVFGSDQIDEKFETDFFLQKTRLNPEEVAGKTVLDAGCGFGRYSYVVRKMGGRVVSVDVSDAVESARDNLEAIGGFVVQADLFSLPLARGSFDIIFSVGVLHHTINTRAAFEQLVPLLKPGGRIVIWVYRQESPEREEIFKKIRDITLTMDFETILKVSEILALVAQSPAVAPEHRNRVPISSFAHHNFDWYSCPLRHHHTATEVEGWFRDAGLEQIDVYGWIHPDGFGGAVGASGRMPADRKRS